jgi:adenylosuccinate synthase
MDNPNWPGEFQQAQFPTRVAGNFVEEVDKFTQAGRASFLIDGQYGSTGKGLIAAYLATHNRVDISVTNASANAGHTTIMPDGTKFVTFHMPTAGVINKDSLIYLDAGAIINPELLFDEIDTLGIDPGRITIHPNAAIITPECIEMEADPKSGATKIASTQKGVGAALAQKVRREGTTAKKMTMDFHKNGIRVARIDLNAKMRQGAYVMVEVPQGYSLSNASMFYPHTTSRQVSVAQAMADAEIHPRYMGKTCMSIRTYPIRVGNISTKNHSGAVYSDQKETDWNTLGVPPETTTVTGRIRRVFTFSEMQYKAASSELVPDYVFLNFCNYMKTVEDLNLVTKAMGRVHRDLEHVPYMLFGMGPTLEDVHTDGSEVLRRIANANSGHKIIF